MSEKPDEKQLAAILPFVTFYGVAVSLLYLFGYWSTFGVNILQYAALSDVIKLAIYPVFIGAILSLSGLLIQILLRGDLKETDPEKVFIILGPGATKWSSLGAGMLLIVVISVWRGNGTAWVIAGILLAYIVNVNTGDFGALRPYVANRVVRMFLFYIVLVILFGSPGRGRQDAEKVLEDKDVRIVSSAIFKGKDTNEFHSKGLLEKHGTRKYLGTCGEYFFFLTPDNEDTVIAKYADLHFLEFKRK